MARIYGNFIRIILSLLLRMRTPFRFASEVARAEIVSEHAFRTMGGESHSQYPLVSTKFQVWELPARDFRRDGSHDWRMGARLGSNASGAGSNHASSVKNTPLAMRRTTVRGLLTLLHSPGQAGFPRRWDPRGDSAHVAMNLREAGKFA